MRTMPNACFVGTTLKSPVLGIPGVRAAVWREMQRWANQWESRGVFIMVRMQCVASATENIAEIYNNTSKIARQPTDDID